MWYADIAPVKPAGYAGRAAALGATNQGTTLSRQGREDSALLTNLHCRCDVLLTGVSERRWHELDDQYTDECIGLPSVWRGIMRRMAMVGQAVHDLRQGGVEPLVWDPSDSD